jgi:uncharacterized protein (DUF1778 family)
MKEQLIETVYLICRKLKRLDLTVHILSVLAANKTVQENNVMRLSNYDCERFANVLINPPAPNKHLLEAAKRYKERMKR